MRRVTAILFFAIFCAVSAAADITLMSYNIAHLKRQAAEGDDDWAEAIAAQIKASGADIVFLQEVPIELDKGANPLFKTARANNVLDDFAKKLGGGWLYFSTANYAIRKNMAVDGENYVYCDMNQNNAILYNSRKVLGKDLADTLGFTSFSGKYLFDKNNVQVVEFRVSGHESEKFVAINIHAPFNNIDHRKRDMATLEKLYASYKNRIGVIIAGDFNTPRSELTSRNFDTVDGNDSFFVDKNFGLKTTISSKGSGVVFANDYDHFICSRKIAIAQSMRRAFIRGKEAKVESYSAGGRSFSSGEEIKKSLSDHLPIVIVLKGS